MNKFSRLFSFIAGLKYIERECRDFILDRVFCFVGEIEEHRMAGSSLITMEAGNWITPEKKRIRGTNIYKWTVADDSELNLEHLRFGNNAPVFLLTFIKTGDKWPSKSPHMCGEDSYYANIKFSDDAMELEWRIKGPKKEMHIRTRYFSR